MFDKVRTKIYDFIGSLLNNKTEKDCIDELLPRDRYLVIKLHYLCSRCHSRNNGKEQRNVSLSEVENMENIDKCRSRHFGLLLQSFVGKPGGTETNCLYSYLKRCEDYLLLRASNGHALLSETGTRNLKRKRIAGS